MAFEEFASRGKVNAEQIEESRSVITPQGAVTGHPGQWEVRYPDGDVRVLDDEAFQTEWGGDESGESEEETPDVESQRTRRNAGAESDIGSAGLITADAGSESDSSQDSDRVHTSSDTSSDKDSESKDSESKDSESKDSDTSSKDRADKTTEPPV
jgi:hypothetical protein